MTGTGTQADPYVFDDVADFLRAISITGAYVTAKSSDMQFNCNTETITFPIDFKCRYFDGKGLTILNPVVDNTGVPIILVHGYSVINWSGGEPQVIKNLNVYNYIFRVAGTTTCLMTDDWDSDGGYKRCSFEHCNFAGSIFGYPEDLGYLGLGTAFIGHNRDNRYMNWVKYELVDCTLNIHFDDATNHDVYFWLHSGDTTGDFGESYLYFNGSTLSMSGTSNLKIEFGNTAGKGLIVESPLDMSDYNLQCQSFNGLLISRGDSGNNEHRMYVETTGDITVNNDIGLIITDRYTAGETKSLSGIVMQENDASDIDYVYNENNLANAGFPVGEVIH